jgi:hypothetical protein
MVVSLPVNVCPAMIIELTRQGIPVLSETPPAPDLQGLIDLNNSIGVDAKLQIAEQYRFQPAYAAMVSIIRSGKLGKISHVQVSAAHGYHGVNLIREFLGIGYENAMITGLRFRSPIISGPGRNGGPTEEKIRNSDQDIASLNFGDKLALFDFTGEQYFSWIRSNRILIRGERGEIINDRIKYLKDYKTPVCLELKRQNAGEAGNLEGYYLKGYIAGDDWCYINPYIPGRLTDDEIAVATCLSKMNEYISGGPGFYSLAEASQDHYLGMMIQKAVTSNEAIQTSTQNWVEKLHKY